MTLKLNFSRNIQSSPIVSSLSEIKLFLESTQLTVDTNLFIQADELKHKKTFPLNTEIIGSWDIMDFLPPEGWSTRALSFYEDGSIVTGFDSERISKDENGEIVINKKAKGTWKFENNKIITSLMNIYFFEYTGGKQQKMFTDKGPFWRLFK
ncbi:MAG: hypothetical protein JXJ04_05225 [Spirochaetales bacterium]|nr:hypothetical protein [Spirochaetales bacterium]